MAVACQPPTARHAAYVPLHAYVPCLQPPPAANDSHAMWCVVVPEHEAELVPALALLDDVYECKAAVAAGKTPPVNREQLLLRARVFCHLPAKFDFM